MYNYAQNYLEPQEGSVHLCRVNDYSDNHITFVDALNGKMFYSESSKFPQYNHRRLHKINKKKYFFVKFTTHKNGDVIDANEFAPFPGNPEFDSIE